MSVHIEKLRVANNWVLDFQFNSPIDPLSALAVAEDLDAVIDYREIAPKWVFHITWDHRRKTFTYPLSATRDDEDRVLFYENCAVINDQLAVVTKDSNGMIDYDDWEFSWFNIGNVLDFDYTSYNIKNVHDTRFGQYYSICEIKMNESAFPCFVTPDGIEHWIE